MKILAAICALTFVGASHAEQTGNALHGWLSNSQSDVVGVAYTTGVLDSEGWVAKGLPYCPPAGVVNSQAIDIVKRYLADRPEERHKPAPLLIYTALSKAFPCKN